MAYGIPRSNSNLIAQEQRILSIPSDPKEKLLAQYITKLAQQNKVGTPEYFIAAGEFQNRQKIRQEQAAKQGQPPPVAQQINQQAAAKAMEDRGVAQLPVGGIGQIGNYTGAMGGIVAFEDGGEVQRFQNQGMVTARVPSFMGAFGGPSERTTVIQPRMMQGIAFNEFGVPISVEEFIRKTKQENPNLTAGELQTRVNDFVRRVTQMSTPSVAQAQTTAAPAAVAQTTQPAPTGAPTTEQAAPSAAPADRFGLLSIPQIPKPNYSVLRTEAENVADQFAGIRPLVEKPEEAIASVKDVYTRAGVDLGLFTRQAEELKKQNTTLDRKEAANMRLIEAGLGILGGESPYAFVNIGKGASPALKGLQEDFKELKKLDRDREREIRNLQVAENQLRAGVGKDAAERISRSEQRLDTFNREDRALRASIFTNMVSANTQREVANLNATVQGRVAEATRAGSREDTLLRSARDLARREIDAKVRADRTLATDPTFNYDSAVDQREAEILQRWKLEGRVSQTTPQAQGNLVRNPDGSYTYKR